MSAIARASCAPALAPRGGHGQGEALTRANVKDFGGGDLRDILAGVDAVDRMPLITG